MTTSRNIQGLTKSLEDLELAFIDQTSQSKSQKLFDQTSNNKHLDKEVDWIEKSLAEVLDIYTKILRITYFFKQWLNKKVVKIKKIEQKKKKWETMTLDTVQLKQAQNQFYRVVHKTKRECRQNFFQKRYEDDNINK